MKRDRDARQKVYVKLPKETNLVVILCEYRPQNSITTTFS